MKPKNLARNSRFHSVAVWKRVVIILIVVAMPLFFSLYRSYQTQQALQLAPAEPTQTQ
jgi:hypothetical protein